MGLVSKTTQSPIQLLSHTIDPCKQSRTHRIASPSVRQLQDIRTQADQWKLNHISRTQTRPTQVVRRSERSLELTHRSVPLRARCGLALRTRRRDEVAEETAHHTTHCLSSQQRLALHELASIRTTHPILHHQRLHCGKNVRGVLQQLALHIRHRHFLLRRHSHEPFRLIVQVNVNDPIPHTTHLAQHADLAAEDAVQEAVLVAVVQCHYLRIVLVRLRRVRAAQTLHQHAFAHLTVRRQERLLFAAAAIHSGDRCRHLLLRRCHRCAGAHDRTDSSRALVRAVCASVQVDAGERFE